MIHEEAKVHVAKICVLSKMYKVTRNNRIWKQLHKKESTSMQSNMRSMSVV